MIFKWLTFRKDRASSGSRSSPTIAYSSFTFKGKPSEFQILFSYTNKGGSGLISSAMFLNSFNISDSFHCTQILKNRVQSLLGI